MCKTLKIVNAHDISKKMIRSIIGILIGIIIFLIGLVIVILESFNTDLFWIGIGLVFAGLGIIALFVIGKIKNIL